MKQDIEQVSEIFRAANWNEIPLSEEMQQPCLNGVYVCDYAAVGVVVCSTVKDVLSRWADCQVQISDLRQHVAVGLDKDLYLTFIFPEIDTTALGALQSIINDTHVCRKICIERRERTLKEALMDTPFFKVVDQEKQLPEAPIDFEDHGLSQQLLEDLARRSSSVVLQKLLSGKYKKAERNED